MENKLVVANIGWGENIPEWLRSQIKEERLICGMANALHPEENVAKTVGNAEVVAYLMTASLSGPLDSEYAELYMYVTADVMLKARKVECLEDLPDFMREIYDNGLSSWRQTQLDNLKSDIGSKRGKISHPILEVFNELKGRNRK